MWWSQELSLGFWTTNFCIFLPVDSVVPTPWSLTADAKKKKKKERPETGSSSEGRIWKHTYEREEAEAVCGDKWAVWGNGNSGKRVRA